MKKIIVVFLGLSILTGSFVSCKKGENDPFLSLKSRKSRLVGNWMVSHEEITEVITNIDSTTTISTIFDGTTEMKSTVIVLDDTTKTYVDTMTYKLTLDIKKDGTYKFSNINGNQLDVYIAEGTWMFIGKSKKDNLKKKEAVLLTTTKTVISDGAVTNSVLHTDLNGKTLVLDQLKSKEMIVILEESNKNENGLVSTKKTTKTTYTIN